MKDSRKIYSDLIITSKENIGLKKYFNSIKRNLPDKWNFLKNENYKDIDTFKILNDVICFKSPYFRNTHLKITFYAKIFCAITDDQILITKISLSEDIQMPDKVFAINHIIDRFHEEVLKSNKYYKKFNHELIFGGPNDENFYQSDIRNERLTRIYSKSDQTTYSFAKGEEGEIDGKRIVIFTPNNISLTLSLMKKAYKKALKLHNSLFNKNYQTIALEEAEQGALYDFFEEIISSIIFAYISVEAMANAAIPEDYELEKINEKGIKEIWSKDNIERWMSTSEKTGNILPNILDSSDIKKEKFWTYFKDLENLRNELIHQKTNNSGTKLDVSIYKELIKPITFKMIKSATSVIQFFYDLDNSHPYFPLGLGIAEFQIKEVDDIMDHFGKLEEVK